ncbi:Serine/threonine-protein kinase ATG1 [Annulohypoxylon truncatum]|uniref:Serine/threonine-protein kinase ATG1 n=1 Tax=Annulohypoxylon truncatum TaxID=327061 RepID=UPI0020078245|nr:Serine/threonine-protein kinase ATG1 [Annulohypoxylon truncatum]KAI1213078.1 Serine/threonine-protein kinase ATG1 [Annulohypoxylon truncatum]
MADPRAPSGSSSRRGRAADDVVGQFIIGSEIGKGSFAQVYRGRHKVSGALVAVKSVELGRLNKKLKENLYSEIKILKKLRHPHIVALHDCVESSTHINLMMEYCELGDLSLFIKRRDKLITHPATCDMARKYPSVPGAGLHEVVIRHFLKQLASALQFLREGNFVHRDIKPQNLLLLPSVLHREMDKDRHPILSASHDSLIPAVGLRSLPMLKLADFGFARVLPSTSLAETLCGSPLYMAPEILRYERYDAKADLWSVGTVAYEMICGKPPFRASNHVELLRKIESSDAQIKFGNQCQVSADLKSMIRALLKRAPVERLSFEDFFSHRVIADEIPGLVEDDIPRIQRQPSRDVRPTSRTEDSDLIPRRVPSHRRYGTDADAVRQGAGSPSPRERPLKPSPLSSPTEFSPYPQHQDVSHAVESPRDDIAPGLGIRRPQPVPSTSAPARPDLAEARRRRVPSNASLNRYSHGQSPPHEEVGRGKGRSDRSAIAERERAAQEIAFERDYVVVEKKHVEVNAFADELAAKGAQAQASSPRSGQITRRATQQGVPTSTTGAIPAQPSNALQIAQGRQRPEHYRRGSYDRNAGAVSSSPGSTTSAIYNAISDASLRFFGFKYPTHLLGKGASPPHPYNAFPTYPTPTAPAGLITDGRQGGPIDEDLRVAQIIEDCATQSDVVWGFAEVKYKQLVPLAPSMEHGLGGIPADRIASEEDDGLTVEAIVALSEEALVLYVKALSLLAKSMDIANIWWTRRNRLESTSAQHVINRDATSIHNLIQRVNSAVQWVRKRFNETLEKAEVVRLKLLEAQKLLPEDHPSHPVNNQLEVALAGTSSTEGIVLTAGLSAEKLMYERALEMSRTAAINEIANEDLPGCEISYVTAIRMLEAVLDNDEDLSKRRLSGSSKTERDIMREGSSSEINSDDQQAVHKMIQMINGRLTALRKKLQMIANASKAQQTLPRKRSGDVAPRSVPIGA